MSKKTLTKQNKKECYKFLAVLIIFLISGIVYSHSFHSGNLEMGKKITPAEIGVVKGEQIMAEELLQKVNINTAEAEELETLSGIGAVRAADIIQYREENGNFRQIEDLMQVSGIGEKTFEEIKERITVGE